MAEEALIKLAYISIIVAQSKSGARSFCASPSFFFNLRIIFLVTQNLYKTALPADNREASISEQ